MKYEYTANDCNDVDADDHAANDDGGDGDDDYVFDNG